jgi:hypothetical protein
MNERDGVAGGDVMVHPAVAVAVADWTVGDGGELVASRSTRTGSRDRNGSLIRSMAVHRPIISVALASGMLRWAAEQSIRQRRGSDMLMVPERWLGQRRLQTGSVRGRAERTIGPDVDSVTLVRKLRLVSLPCRTKWSQQ